MTPEYSLSFFAKEKKPKKKNPPNKGHGKNNLRKERGGNIHNGRPSPRG
jgi:hypothetical protein